MTRSARRTGARLTPRASQLLAGAAAGVVLAVLGAGAAQASPADGQAGAAGAASSPGAAVPAGAGQYPCPSRRSITRVVIGSRYGWVYTPLGVGLPQPPPPEINGQPVFTGPGPELGSTTSVTVTRPPVARRVAAVLCAPAFQPRHLGACPAMPFSFPNTIFNYWFSFSAGDRVLQPVIVGPGGCAAVRGLGVVRQVPWPQFTRALAPLDPLGRVAPTSPAPADWALPAFQSGCPPSGPPAGQNPPCLPVVPAGS